MRDRDREMAEGIGPLFRDEFRREGERQIAEALAEARAQAETDARKVMEALAQMASEAIETSENELGEDYMRCSHCDATEWGSERDDFDEHSAECPFAAVAEYRRQHPTEDA